jgi:hypothetical protein
MHERPADPLPDRPGCFAGLNGPPMAARRRSPHLRGTLAGERLQEAGVHIAAIWSAVARPAVSSITETRYCNSDHLLRFGVPLAGGRSPLLRTPLARSDTAARVSLRLSW